MMKCNAGEMRVAGLCGPKRRGTQIKHWALLYRNVHFHLITFLLSDCDSHVQESKRNTSPKLKLSPESPKRGVGSCFVMLLLFYSICFLGTHTASLCGEHAHIGRQEVMREKAKPPTKAK